jgi:glycosyltransferase involved in cell wall biosynthesis
LARVTILTPSYNQRRFIGACIESVLEQSFPDWEQIVIDDGSTDGTAEHAESYGDPRIKVLRLPHRGLSQLAQSYNAGLALASGELIAVLEGDDAWPVRKLESQVPAFDADDVFISWGRASFVDEHGRITGKLSTVLTRDPVEDIDASDLFARLVRTNPLVPAASVMIRRSALDAVGGFQQDVSTHYVDLSTWLVLAAATRGRARFVNAELAFYRVHEAQTSQRFRAHMDLEHFRIVMAAVSNLDEATRLRLRWKKLKPHAEVAGLIAEARAAFASGDFSSARRVFGSAFGKSTNAVDRAKAALGLLSALVHIDLLDPVLYARAHLISRRTR